MQIQQLESRRLLAAEIDGSTLIYRGADTAENIIARITPTQATFNVDGAVQMLALAGVTKTRIFLGGGDDVVEFRAEGGDALSQITLNGEGGSDRFTVISSADTRANFRAFLGDGDDLLDLGGQFPNPRNANRATIYGEAGNDTVRGTGNNDYIILGDGFDVGSGLGGDDYIDGNANGDQLFGNDGDDTLSMGGGDDEADGGSGNDTMSGGDGNDNLSGSNGQDTLIGGVGTDTMTGGEGDDILVGNGGRDRMDGSAGTDTLLGQNGADVLNGGDGGDRISGGNDDDVLNGGRGRDTLEGNDGRDFLSGGEDRDYLDAGAKQDTLLGGTHTDTLHGQAGGDFLFGEEGVDLLYGEADTDTFISGEVTDNEAQDSVDAQIVFDLDVVNRTIVVNTGDTVDSVRIQGGFRENFSLSVVSEIGFQDDNFLGGFTLFRSDFAKDDIDGIRVIFGGGNDTLFNDTSFEMRVPVTVYGGDGDDTVDFNGYNDLRFYGEAGNDRVPDGDDRTIIGKRRLYGGPGNDTLIGSYESDYILGEDGDDVLGGDHSDSIYTPIPSDDTLDGGAGNDTINGGPGDDTLNGGTGNDSINGGTGADALTGGADADTFLADEQISGEILDFQNGVDTLTA